MKNNFLLITVLLAFTLQALSSEQLMAPAEDSQYKYYLGVAEDMTSLAEAINTSFRNAAETAIRENFGFLSQIERTTFEDSKDSQLSVVHHEKSAKVRLEGFETAKSEVTQNPQTQKYTVKTVYKYSKASLRNETLRLRTAVEPEAEMSEVGELKLGKASLELKTEPAGASFMMDGIKMPNTPLKISGQIEGGLHKISVDHPYFEAIDEEIMFRPNELLVRRYILKPAMAEISVDTVWQAVSAALRGDASILPGLPAIGI